MKLKYMTAANGITLLRIVGTVVLLFSAPMSPLFLWIYTLTGLTDMPDGWIARKTGTADDFGARFDSIADLLFYSVMLIRLLPALRRALPLDIWYAVGVILLVRLSAYCTAVIKYRRFAPLHTHLNKLTGAAVFLLPYFFAVSSGIVYSRVVCALAFAASSEELAIHLCRKSYLPDTKTILKNNSL